MKEDPKCDRRDRIYIVQHVSYEFVNEGYEWCMEATAWLSCIVHMTIQLTAAIL